MDKERKTEDYGRHHECEIFTTLMPEAAESASRWKNCTKNPAHSEFISAQIFKDKHLPKLQDVRTRELLRHRIDFTVRLTVEYTSLDRPDDDKFCYVRGHRIPRKGTGFLHHVDPPELNKPCHCVNCAGERAKKQWAVLVRTAHHVVYDTEEAKKTQIDLFVDDESCERDGKMKCVWGLQVLWSKSENDMCFIWCVTCDEVLGEWLESAWRQYDRIRKFDLDLTGLDILPCCDKDSDLAMIVSHPHGQPKKITIGERRDADHPHRSYTVPTCPGSSGAPIFKLTYNRDPGKSGGVDLLSIYSHVHSGSDMKTSPDKEDQLNFGFYWF